MMRPFTPRMKQLHIIIMFKVLSWHIKIIWIPLFFTIVLMTNNTALPYKNKEAKRPNYPEVSLNILCKSITSLKSRFSLIFHSTFGVLKAAIEATCKRSLAVYRFYCVRAMIGRLHLEARYGQWIQLPLQLWRELLSIIPCLIISFRYFDYLSTVPDIAHRRALSV